MNNLTKKKKQTLPLQTANHTANSMHMIKKPLGYEWYIYGLTASEKKV